MPWGQKVAANLPLGADDALLVYWTGDEDLVQLRRIPLGLSRLTMKVDYAAIGLLPIEKEARRRVPCDNTSPHAVG